MASHKWLFWFFGPFSDDSEVQCYPQYIPVHTDFDIREVCKELPCLLGVFFFFLPHPFADHFHLVECSSLLGDRLFHELIQLWVPARWGSVVVWCHSVSCFLGSLDLPSFSSSLSSPAVCVLYTYEFPFICMSMSACIIYLSVCIVYLSVCVLYPISVCIITVSGCPGHGFQGRCTRQCVEYTCQCVYHNCFGVVLGTVLVLCSFQGCCTHQCVLYTCQCVYHNCFGLSWVLHRVLVLHSFQGRGTAWGSRWLSAGRMTVPWDPPPTTLCPETTALSPCCIQLLGKRQTGLAHDDIFSDTLLSPPAPAPPNFCFPTHWFHLYLFISN